MATNTLNILSTSPDGRARLLSNFAHTPFILDGVAVASVEGFWQGLKLDEGSPLREQAFALWGLQAQRMKWKTRPREHFIWQGRLIPVGSAEHLALLRRALVAKFTQSETARAALLATRGLTLTHNVAQSSQTVLPGAVFTQMLMDLRDTLLTVSVGE